MALLTVQYTAPLPTGFVSGTVEIKSQFVYVDAASRTNQPFKKYTLGADRSLTSLQGDATPVIVGMGSGDPATAGPLDVIVTMTVSGLPTPQRSTFQVAALDTGGGTLNLHAANTTAPIVGPYTPPVSALISTVTDRKFVSPNSSNPTAPTAGDLTTYPGNIYGTRFLASGATQTVLWDRTGSVWGDFGQPAATKADTDSAIATANSASGTATSANTTATATKSAVGNLTLTALNSKAQADGPQFVDGSRWAWSSTGTANGGTVVAGTTGFWKREYPGSTVYGSWFGMVADYDWTTNTGTDNTPMLRAMIGSGAQTCVIESALNGYFLDASSSREITIPVGVTVRGSTSTRNTRKHVQFPFAKLVIKQTTHPVFTPNTNTTLKNIMFVYPVMSNTWTSAGQATVLSASAGPTTPPVITTYQPAVNAYRVVTGDSLEGFTLDNVGIVGGTTLFNYANSASMGQVQFKDVFGYCFGPMFVLGRAADSIRANGHHISPNFLPAGTTVDFMSYTARDVAVWMRHAGKVDDFRAQDCLIYGQQVGVDLLADNSQANYSSGGTYINVGMDGVGIGYRIGGRTPAFGMHIIGGFITPVVGNPAGTSAVVVTSANAGASVIDMTGVRVYGTTDGAVASTSNGGSNTHLQVTSSAANVTFNISNGKFFEYTTADTANDGLGGFYFADAGSSAGLRMNLANVTRKDGKSMTTAQDGLFVGNGGTSTAANLKGLLNRSALPVVTATNLAAAAAVVGSDYNKLVADLADMKAKLVAAGIISAT